MRYWSPASAKDVKSILNIWVKQELV